MKKIYFSILASFTAGFICSQNSIALATLNNPGTATVMAVSNGTTLAYTTSAGGLTSIKFRITNLSGSQTITYSVLRIDKSINPGASAYFCFGMSCFPTNVYTPPSSADYITLSPGAYSDQPVQFTTDLQEDMSNVGYSEVRYRVYNTNSSNNDTLSFTMKYNQILGVHSISNVVESVSDIYPNPSNASAFVNVTLKTDADVKLNVYNALGSLEYSTSQKYSSGKHKLSLDCNNLNNGIYFVTVISGDSKITKRLIVNK